MKRPWMIFVPFILLIFLVQPAAAQLTISNLDWISLGNKRALTCDVAFDSSYAWGGESLTGTSVGMTKIDRVIAEGKDGTIFEYDYTNSKLKAFRKAPAVVYGEQQTIASNQITLNYPAAYIINVAQSNAPVKIATSGATVLSTTDECQPTSAFTAGARSGVTFGTSMTGTVYVDYVTQAWKDVWDNLVQNEDVPLTSNSGMFDYQALAIQAATILGGIKTNSALMLDKDDTVATGELKVDFTSVGASTLTGVSTVAGDGGTTVVATYVKKPSSGFLSDNWVEEETALQSGTSKFYVAGKLLLWGYGGQVPVNSQTTQRLINDRGTTGTNESYLSFKTGVSSWEQITMGQNIAPTTATYVQGHIGEVNTVPLEVPNGVNLSELTGVKLFIFGY